MVVNRLYHKPVDNLFIGGVYWTKFEYISDKIRRILTNDTCASAALAKLARGKTQKFPIIFICGSPHTPRREAEHLKGRKFLVLLRRFSLRKEQSYFNTFVCSFLHPHGDRDALLSAFGGNSK